MLPYQKGLFQNLIGRVSYEAVGYDKGFEANMGIFTGAEPGWAQLSCVSKTIVFDTLNAVRKVTNARAGSLCNDQTERRVTAAWCPAGWRRLSSLLFPLNSALFDSPSKRMQLRSLLIGVGLLLFLPALTASTLEFPKAGSEGLEAKRITSDHPVAGPPATSGIGPKLIEPDPDAGFEYPYYLYAPEKGSGSVGTDGSAVPILVEPNNTGLASDDLAPHRKYAKRQIERGMSRILADSLGVPVVKPVFPRPVRDPVDWTHYVHSLDLETMQIEEGPLQGVDRQLLSMVEDARERLREAGYDLRDGIMVNGFSGSGVFANRFAALHPEEVISVTAGGIGGMPILPFSEIKTRHPVVEGDTYPLGYQVGTEGIENLTGEPFDREAFLGIRQFLYVGGQDKRDPLPYPDAYTKKETRLAALLAYRTDMQEQRFPRAKAAYEAAGAKAVFRIYEGVGHKPASAEDLVEFHNRALEGDSIGAIRADLGGNVPSPSRRPNLLP